METAQKLSLTPAAVEVVNEILSRGKSVEIGFRGGKVVVWEMTSKKKHEVTVKVQ